MKAICGHASEWNNHLIRPAVGKCRGMYERRALLLCSPCSVATYYDYDYWDLSAACDCCIHSAGTAL